MQGGHFNGLPTQQYIHASPERHSAAERCMPDDPDPLPKAVGSRSWQRGDLGDLEGPFQLLAALIL